MSVQRSRLWQPTLFAAFTLILAGYLSVWLPHEAAGLSFIGVELGEWVKFLPQVQSGEPAANRELFYLPPLTLAAMMVLVSARWSGRRWQTWAFRALALLVAMLAFPSLDAIRFEPASEWLLRFLLVATVAILALGAGFLAKLPPWLLWFSVVFLALSGALLPSWVYLSIRQPVASLWREQPAIGAGVWLNFAGHVIAGGIAAWCCWELIGGTSGERIESEKAV